jgi:1-phosphatidylinositol-3-phosphate 5-kinase
VTVLFPLKFEALRRAYCGTREEYILSIFKVESWKATGGRTSAAFSKTHDEKYVIKEIKEKEFLWFVEFGQVYFEYMAKVLFKN